MPDWDHLLVPTNDVFTFCRLYRLDKKRRWHLAQFKAAHEEWLSVMKGLNIYEGLWLLLDQNIRHMMYSDTTHPCDQPEPPKMADPADGG